MLAGIVAVALLVGGAAYADREIGPRALGPGSGGEVHSGAWYCPHGGGPEGWDVRLQVANPGPDTATIRVRTFGSGKPTTPETLTVEPGSMIQLPVPADGRERSSAVEWFDQWVAVGWISHAGGGEGGVAAEPCAPEAGGPWFLPDGTTETDEQMDVVVVMNPFARDAVFSLLLFSDRNDPVQQGDLTDVVLKPYHSAVFRLDRVVAGERTVSTQVDVSVGRVAAATLGVSTTGGIRSSLGYLGVPPAQLVLPGGGDAGRSDLAVMSTGTERVSLGGLLLLKDSEQAFAGLSDTSPPAESARTFPATTAGPTSVAFSVDGEGVAAARRTFGVVSDQASTIGAVPAAAWIVLPAVGGSPSLPNLVLANPGDETAEVEITYLAPAEGSIVVTIPPGRTATPPAEFRQIAPDAAVSAIALQGTFVPAAASYSLGREGIATYAVALGIRVPDAWLRASSSS